MGVIECATCGYDLSAHTQEYRAGVRCPECGDADAARARFERVGVDALPRRRPRTEVLAVLLGVIGVLMVFVKQKPSVGGGAELYGWLLIAIAGWMLGSAFAKRLRKRSKGSMPR